MGASNVAAVFARHAALNDVPFRLLAYMALISLDRDAPPRFWGGREDLATALGRRVPPAPPEDDTTDAATIARRSRRAAFEAVRAGMLELRNVGAITVAATARPGRNAEYELHLTAQGQPVPSDASAQADPGPSAQAQPGPSVQAQPVNGTGSPCASAQADPGPEEKARTTGTRPGEIGPSTSPTVQTARPGICTTHRWADRRADGECAACFTERVAV